MVETNTRKIKTEKRHKVLVKRDTRSWFKRHEEREYFYKMKLARDKVSMQT